METLQHLLKSLAQCFRSRQPPPSTPSTTIILSHGAFSTPWHYNLYTSFLKRLSLQCLCPAQSSSSPSPPPDSFDQDIELLSETIRTELLSGRDVLLVCHSYGGIPGCEALAELDLPEKGVDGKRLGRVLGIVFVSAFVAEAGMSLVSSKMEGTGRAPWVRIEGNLSHVLNPSPTLYNHVQPACLRDRFISRLVPQSSTSFLTPTKHETWKEYPCYYIRCLHDQAMVVEEQDFFIERLRSGCGERVRVKELECDHVPFASVPERLAEVTKEIVEELWGSKL